MFTRRNMGEQQVTEFRCDVCGAVFKDSDALLKHKRVHQASTAKEDEGDEPLEQGTQKPTGPSELPPPGPQIPQPHV